jgi:hypothetical protein
MGFAAQCAAAVVQVQAEYMLTIQVASCRRLRFHLKRVWKRGTSSGGFDRTSSAGRE